MCTILAVVGFQAAVLPAPVFHPFFIYIKHSAGKAVTNETDSPLVYTEDPWISATDLVRPLHSLRIKMALSSTQIR